MRAIGYARTSTSRQDLSLEVQEKQIRLACEMRGITELTFVAEQVSSGVSPSSRPLLSGVLDSLKNNDADVLIVAKLDRVARSSAHIAVLMDDANTQGWNLIALDLGVDTTTPEGALVVGIMASIAQWERARIRERTREALQQAKANGTILGRPPVSVKAKKRAYALNDGTRSLNDIAKQLEKEGLTSSTGKRLSKSTISRLIR